MITAMSCAKELRVPETVGPVPETASSMGRLIVFTEFRRRTAEDNYANDERLPYALFDASGHYLRTVSENHQTPETVALAAGEYLVHAKGRHYAHADVRVRIDPGRTTAVFLDGTRPSTQAPSDALVHAANGAIIGWRTVE